ncbi:MAG: exodeoxyribonuclease VII small subunit [Eggerthellaceae bacterium]|nr:exodeoxyribonuclease VII small subunit [Eggerthellaceae bacterium]
MKNETAANYLSVKDRLDEIVEIVSDEEISLDDALDLYEEAVKLGLSVSNLLEEDIAEEELASVLEEQFGESGQPADSSDISADSSDIPADSSDMPVDSNDTQEEGS